MELGEPKRLTSLLGELVSSNEDLSDLLSQQNRERERSSEREGDSIVLEFFRINLSQKSTEICVLLIGVYNNLSRPNCGRL